MNDNTWPTGKVAVIMPEMPEHLATPAVQRAYDIRLQANMDGLCPACGATVQLPNRHGRRKAEALGLPSEVTMRHEASCPAGDEVFGRLLSAAMN